MKKYLALLLLFTLHACCSGVLAQTSTKTNSDQVFEFLQSGNNFVKNPFARLNTNNVSCTSSPLATKGRVTGTTKFKGVGSHTIITPGGVGAYCEPTINTPTQPHNGPNFYCDAEIFYSGLTAGGYAMVVGGTQTVPMRNTASGEVTSVYLTLPCAATAPTIRMQRIVAGVDSPVEYAVYYGPTRRLGKVPDSAYLFGSAEQAGVGGCVYSQSTSTGLTNWIDLGVGTGCNAWTTSGKITSVGTNDHRVTLTTMPAGDYQVQLTGSYSSFVANQNCAFRLSDGTNTYQPLTTYSSSAGLNVPASMFHISNTTAKSAVTLKIQASDSGTGSCGWDNGSAALSVGWKIYYFPPAASATAATLDQMDYPPRPYTPTFTGFGTVSNVDCTEARQSAFNIIDCSFTSGVATSTEARVSLPNSRVSTTWSPAVTKEAGFAGNERSSASLFKWAPLIESNKGYLTFGLQDSSNPSLLKRNGDSISSNGIRMSFKAWVPIAGWETPAPPGVIKIDPPVFNPRRFTTGTAQTYTVPDGVKWLRVTKLRGGGGGGGGSAATASDNAGNGGVGGQTNFGVLGANGGAGGQGAASQVGGAGGTASLNGISGYTYTGNPGDNASSNTTNTATGRSYGGLGGAGYGSGANSGSGGKGAGNASGNTLYAGGGGGAGGYLEAFIPVTAGQTFTYTIGAGGTAGAAGTGGASGSVGQDGVIEFEEHYTSWESALASGLLARIPGANVTDSGSDTERTIRFAFGGASEVSDCTSSPCTIYRSTSPMTITRSGVGDYVLTVATPFADKFGCWFTHARGNNAGTAIRTAVPTTTTYTFSARAITSGSNQDMAFDGWCSGPKVK